MLPLRSRYVILPLILLLATFTLFILRTSLNLRNPISALKGPAPPLVANDGETKSTEPRYKPPKEDPIPPPLPEYFPLAAAAKSPADLPPVPSWNKPPDPHVPENTRLYIGFTRFWPLLQQVVISYITAGWPPEDIYVVENTGTFDANKNGQLSSSNPFYLDYHRLTKIFGVNVLTTPSLQTFAQLQNLYLSEAINNNLSYYFWGHMDVIAQTHEDATPYKSLYEIAVDTIRESVAPDFERDPETGEKKMWAIRFFSYDWFALVNVEAYKKVGGWDSMIGYYGTDCDMHSRLAMNDLITPIADAGKVYDVGRSMDDLEVLYRRRKKGGGGPEDNVEGEEESAEKKKLLEGKPKEERGLFSDEEADETDSSDESSTNSTTLSSSSSKISETNDDPSPKDPPTSQNLKTYLETTEPDTLGSRHWTALQASIEGMAEEKRTDPYRNSWQLKQRGGQGEPFYYDADGWEKALQMTIDLGLKINEEKWGHRGCDIRAGGLKEGDQWRVDHDASFD